MIGRSDFCRSAIYVALLVLLPCGVHAALNRDEQAIQAFITSQQPQAIATLEKLVNIQSNSLNFAGTQSVGAELIPSLHALGFKTRWVSVPSSVHRAPHLFAERIGTQGKRVLLIGHLDTVFAKTDAFQKFTRQGRYATGPGVIDMKGGLVVMLQALQALHHVGALDDTTLTIALMSDEENTGEPIDMARQPLLEAAQRSDVALEFEWSYDIKTATVARRGFSQWLLQVQAPPGHSSRIFQPTIGNGAVLETARILSMFQQQLASERYLTFNPGLIAGGTNVQFDAARQMLQAAGDDNVIATKSETRGDLRYLSVAQRDAAKAKMEAIVKQVSTGVQARLQIIDKSPAMSPTKGNEELLAWYSRASEDLGYGAVSAYDPGLRGASDVSYVAPLIPCLAGLGPVGQGAHSPQEQIDLDSLPIASSRVALLLYRLVR